MTDPANPVEIGLTSHIGEAHTVNVDPKRPHIAYAVTSDCVSVDDDGTRANEDPAGGAELNLDGFEVVDISSCMNFPAGTTRRAEARAHAARRSSATATRTSRWRSATRNRTTSTAATSSRSIPTTA